MSDKNYVEIEGTVATIPAFNEGVGKTGKPWVRGSFTLRNVQKSKWGDKEHLIEFQAFGQACDLMQGLQANERVTVIARVESSTWVNPKGETVRFQKLQIEDIKTAATAGPQYGNDDIPY